MKTKPLMKNTLFKINIGIVIFLSIGAGYFTLIPLVMFERDFFTVVGIVTQNATMIGLWIVYLTAIAFLPLSRTIGGEENEN